MIDQLPDANLYTHGTPAIALFANNIEATGRSISVKVNRAIDDVNDALWAQVLLHEIGHGLLPIKVSCYAKPSMRQRSEALANWFAWRTLKDKHQFIFAPLTETQSEEYRSYLLINAAEPLFTALLKLEAKDCPSSSRLKKLTDKDHKETNAKEPKNKYEFIKLLCQSCLPDNHGFQFPRIDTQENHDGIKNILERWEIFCAEIGCPSDLNEMEGYLQSINARKSLKEAFTKNNRGIKRPKTESLKKKML